MVHSKGLFLERADAFRERSGRQRHLNSYVPGLELQLYFAGAAVFCLEHICGICCFQMLN